MNELDNTKSLPKEKKRLSKLFSEYCDSSSIHGVRYIGHYERSIWERILWFLIITGCIYGSVKFCLQVYDKWQNHPVIVTFEDTSTPIEKIPFPAVTICPGIKVQKQKFSFEGFVHKWQENFKNITETEFRQFEVLYNVQGCDYIPNFNYNESQVKQKLPITRALFRMAPRMSEIFQECYWQGELVRCNKLWSRTLTIDGICYTFNSLGNQYIYRNTTIHNRGLPNSNVPNCINWNPETGYTKQLCNETEFYPRKVFTAGFEVGLYVELKGSADNIDSYCGGRYPGFKVMVHSPNELPDAGKSFVRLPFGHEVLLAIKPNMRSTSFDLKDMYYSKRQCFFEFERYLKYFKSYTEVNCLVECLANYSTNFCGCSSFHLPRDNKIRECSVDDRECTLKALKFMMQNESGFGECHCVPACTAIKYNMEASVSKLGNEQTKEIKQHTVMMRGSNQRNLKYATISIFYKEDQFWSAKREALFGQTEVLANFGGVLGLFLGVSVLSLAEILYFSTFRLFQFLFGKK